jgi:hypothetical protein
VSTSAHHFCDRLKTLDWDQHCLEFFDVRSSCLAKIVSNSEVYGNIAVTVLAGTPISGMIGDQQSALVGNKCLTTGEAKNTYGTGAFLLYVSPPSSNISPNRVLTAIDNRTRERRLSPRRMDSSRLLRTKQDRKRSPSTPSKEVSPSLDRLSSGQSSPILQASTQH